MDPLATSLAVCAGVSVIGGGVAVVRTWVTPVIDGLKKNQQALLDVPKIREDLAKHEAKDDGRFDALVEKLDRMDRKLDLAANDVGWLRELEERRGDRRK